MKYTDNYHFDLYEPTDNANLLDGYNHSMQMVDGVLQQMNALLVTAQNALTAYDTRITALEKACDTVNGQIADLTGRVQKLEAK